MEKTCQYQEEWSAKKGPSLKRGWDHKSRVVEKWILTMTHVCLFILRHNTTSETCRAPPPIRKLLWILHLHIPYRLIQHDGIRTISSKQSSGPHQRRHSGIIVAAFLHCLQKQQTSRLALTPNKRGTQKDTQKTVAELLLYLKYRGIVKCSGFSSRRWREMQRSLR